MVTIIDRIADVIAGKYSLPGFDQADVKQEVWLEALALLEKFSDGRAVFDSSRGSIASLIYVSLTRRMLNRIRDTVYRNDTPCKKCGRGEFCRDSEPCEAFKRWRERNESKRNIALGTPLHLVDDQEEASTRTESQVEADAETKEIIHLLDAELSVEHRELMLRMRSGEKLPKAKRVVLMDAVADVLDDHGLPLPAYLNPAA